MNRLLAGAAALAVATTAVIASPAHAVERAPRAATAHVTISDFGYSGNLTVVPGEHVVVTNKDSVAHTLTDKVTHLFDTGTIAGNGGTGSFTAPKKSGRYAFGCTFHPDMAGTLVVRVPAAPKDATSLSASKSVVITKGHSTTVRTTLTDRHTKHVLGHTTITLVSRPDSTHAFHKVRTATTSAAGHGAIAVHPVRRTQYEWRYAGDKRHAASHSAVITIGVR